MKVLHVIPAVAPATAAPAAAVVAMCRALAAHGIEPMLVTTDADGPGRLDVPLGQPTMWQGVPAIAFPAAVQRGVQVFAAAGRVAAAPCPRIRSFTCMPCSLTRRSPRPGSRAARRPLHRQAAGDARPVVTRAKAGRKRLLLSAMRHAAPSPGSGRFITRRRRGTAGRRAAL